VLQKKRIFVRFNTPGQLSAGCRWPGFNRINQYLNNSMATLEKIRSKSVLLLIIIAVALLAFILGDFLTSGRSFFGPGTTIAKVDGHKIDVQEFQRRLETANQQAQAQGQKIDGAVLQQQVLNSMIAEVLFDQEMEKLGIKVTDKELSDAMFGTNASIVDQMVQQQTGIESAATLHDMAFNPSKYQLQNEQAQWLQNYWINLEEQVDQSLKQQKFQALFMGTLVANDLDAKAIYDDNAVTSHIAYAKKDYSSLQDDKYPVSDNEIDDEWNKRKNRYRLELPSRLVDYISVSIAPSTADLQAGQKKVEDAITALRTQESTNGLDGKTEFIVERRNFTRSDLRTPGLKSFVDSAAIGHAALVNHTGNQYTLAKLLGTSSQVDSVLIDYLLVQGTHAQVDSMIKVLNAGTTIADAAKSPLVGGSQDSVWVSMVSPDMATVRPILENATAGVFFTPDTANTDNGRIFRVRSRRAPVTVYDLAEISYTIEPSSATINQLQGDLEKFLKENATAETFAKNASAAGYNIMTAVISAASPRLGQLNESHAAVAWALEAKKGEVSPSFGDQSSENLIAVAVEDIYNNGYVTTANPDVRQELTDRVRNAKKGDDLIKQYQGKARDLAGYASLMGSQVDSANVNFGQIFIPGLGVNESALTAEVAAAKQGQIVGPVKANNGVVVFTVTSTEKNARPFNAEESAMQFQQSRGAGALARNIVEILRGNKKVENNIPTFYK